MNLQEFVDQTDIYPILRYLRANTRVPAYVFDLNSDLGFFKDFLLEEGLVTVEEKPDGWTLKYGTEEHLKLRRLSSAALKTTPKFEKLIGTIKTSELFIEYSEDPYTTDAEDSDEPYSYRGNTYYNGRFEAASFERSYGMVTSVHTTLSPGEQANIVWATYGDGDTFGHDEGRFEVVGVCKTQAVVDFFKEVWNYEHNEYFNSRSDIEVAQVQL